MQTSISHKTKQLFGFAIKLAIVIGATYFIYNKLVYNSQLNFDTFVQQLKASEVFTPTTIIMLLFITFLNWFVEIFKWKTLVKQLKQISLWESSAQTLGGLTASLFTPNRVGEYGAKALYFQGSERKQVVGLNFLGNSAQLLVTVSFGIVGFVFFISQFGVELPWRKIARMCIILMVFIGLFLLVSKQKRFQLKGYSWANLKGFIRRIPNTIHLKNLGFSMVRYLLFSHQFYFLLVLFGLNTSYVTAMSTITSMYLITSLIPMLFIFDVIVKGSLAVWLFGYLNVPELTILMVVSLMWILNFVLPSMLGSYFVLNFNPSFVEEKTMAS